jgi:hypothetical protein
MPDAPDLDGCLRTARVHLGTLVDALGRADVAAMEAAAHGVARTASQLQALGPSAAADAVSAQQIDDLRWLLERARRLGRPFGHTSMTGEVPAYRPDGHVVHPPGRSSMLGVTG